MPVGVLITVRRLEEGIAAHMVVGRIFFHGAI